MPARKCSQRSRNSATSASGGGRGQHVPRSKIWREPRRAMRGWTSTFNRTSTMAQVKELARHELPPLPYDFAALEPYIDAQTMQIHHGKHHQAYITNLNNALNKHPELLDKSLEDLLRGINSVAEDIRTTVRNNGGGHHNHSRACSNVVNWEEVERRCPAVLWTLRENPVYGNPQQVEVDGFRQGLFDLEVRAGPFARCRREDHHGNPLQPGNRPLDAQELLPIHD